MNLLRKIVNQFNGLHYPQEYLCIANESFESPLHAWLVCNGQIIKDITKLHLFVGYSPLIIALPALKEIGPGQVNTIDITLSDKPLIPNEKLHQKDAIATLRLKRIPHQPADNDGIWYFEAVEGSHRFLSPFHQWVIRLNNRLSNKKAGNVFLHDNLYTQVQVAYSLPRNISLITVGENERYNLFPTDLHGKADDQLYIISLRHEGKACQQVMQTRRILITQVEPIFYKTVYALGKNHMREFNLKENYPFSNVVSDGLGLPVPYSAVIYRELEILESFVHGIHRVFLLKILSQHHVQNESSTLAHIHNVYATWRYNNHLPGNYLLR